MTIATDQITVRKFTLATSVGGLGKEFLIQGLPRNNASDLVVSVYATDGTVNTIGRRIILDSAAYSLSDLFPSDRDVTLTFNAGLFRGILADGTEVGIHPDISGNPFPLGSKELIGNATLRNNVTLEVAFTRNPNQLTNFREGSRTTAASIENALDQNTMAIKSINRELDRALKVGPQLDDSGFKGDIVGTSATSDLADRAILFSPDGTELRAGPTRRELKGDKGDVGEHAVLVERIYYVGTAINPALWEAVATRVFQDVTIRYSGQLQVFVADNAPGGQNEGWSFSRLAPRATTGQVIYYFQFEVHLDTNAVTGRVEARKGDDRSVVFVLNRDSNANIRADLGTRTDTVSRTGTAFARIAQNRADIDENVGDITSNRREIGTNRQTITDNANLFIGRLDGMDTRNDRQDSDLTTQSADIAVSMALSQEDRRQINLTRGTTIPNPSTYDPADPSTQFSDIPEISSGTAANLNNIAAQLRSLSNDISNASISRSSLGSRITDLTNRINNLPSGGGGGASQAAIDSSIETHNTSDEAHNDIRTALHSVAQSVPGDDRVFPRSENANERTLSHSFGAGVDGFSVITDTYATTRQGNLDIPITERETAVGGDVPTGPTILFGDSVERSAISNDDIPLVIYSPNVQNGFQIDTPAGVGAFNAFVVYSRGLNSAVGVNPAAAGDGATIELDQFRNRRNTFSLGRPIDLVCNDAGSRKSAAIIFFIPVEQPSNPGPDNPLLNGYVSVLIEGATHPSITLEWGTTTNSDGTIADAFQMAIDHNNPGTAFFRGPSSERVPVTVYTNPLPDVVMRSLFGYNSYNSLVSNSGLSNGVTGSNNTVLFTQFKLRTRENNLNMSLQAFTTGTRTPITTKRMNLGHLLALANASAPAPVIPDPTPVQYVKRHRYVNFYVPSTSPLDTNSRQIVVRSDAPPSYAYTAGIFAFWQNVSYITLYMNIISSVRTDWDRGGGGQGYSATFDISSLPKAINLPTDQGTGASSRVYYLSQYLAGGTGNTELDLLATFQSLNRTPYLILQVASSRVKNSGTWCRYVQQGVAVEERYIDSSITNWYRETGIQSAAQGLSGITRLTLADDDRTFTASGEGMMALPDVAPSSTVLKNFVDVTSEANNLISLVSTASYTRSNRGTGRNYPYIWKVNHACTIDMQIRPEDRREGIGPYKFRRVRASATGTVNVSTSGDLVLNVTTPNDGRTVGTAGQARATFAEGDLIFFMAGGFASNVPLPNVTLQAFAL